GTVESSGESGGGTDTTGGGTDTTGSSTTPSSTFAPLGAGDTIYVGTIAGSGGDYELTQDFIVSGTVNSGIYSLPVTLRFNKPDGSAGQVNLRASIVVVAPPKLQIILDSPIPENVNAGEPFPIALTFKNN